MNGQAKPQLQDTLQILHAPIVILPSEVLMMIFLHAIPPNFLLDPSLSRGPNSLWCKTVTMKEAIIMVCKEWYAAGIGYLYEDVVLRRLHQIPAFFRTIEEITHLRELVKGVTISAVIPWKYGSSVSRHLQRIIEICPHISKFALAPPCRVPGNLRLPASVGPNITCLEFNDSVSATDILFLLDIVRETLSSLSIQVHNRSLPGLPESQQICELPRLEFMCVDLSRLSPLLNDSIGGFLAMPHLRRLTINQYSYAGTEDNRHIEYIDSFCKRHGRSLRFLHIQHALERGQLGVELQDACPSLEHLVISSPLLLARLSHPNVKWLDFWHTLRGYCDFDDDVHELLKRQSLPKLEYVREISASLDSIRNIPLIMNPRTSDFSSDAFEFRFPGVLLRYSTGIFTGGTHIDETDWESDFYLDKDYTSSNDEVEDSDASWSQTSSECSPEDFVLGDAFDDASGSDASLEEICHGIDVVS